ncbi:branched-chain amino acid ABC transporter permease [Mumia sp. ZJ1417]|uniref:branched-chain amino acid ABC transporter permease n=1 Tax=Mumia sp. ZJ1417 TaxID=2708082 RepID=UPI001AB04F70|nr:branched-chain amino acid ABC transporter permease [Mumia sp. ZJ1417]
MSTLMAHPGAPKAVVRRSARSSRWTVLALGALVVLLAALPFLVFESVTSSLFMLFVYVVIASMWNLLAGFGGMVSVGQQAFIGVGAYTVVALADQGLSPFLALVFAALTAAILAIPTSWLAFRLRGDYFAVGTWVIAEVYRLVVIKIDALGGPSGRPLTGMSTVDQTLRAAFIYWSALGVAILTVAACYWLLRGRVGLALTAVRDDHVAARASGVDVARAKYVVYLASAAGCGAAGGLLVINALSVQPDAIFSVQWSAYMIFIVVIGGIGYLEGPIVGAVVFFALQQLLADSGSWYLIVLGVLAAASAIWMPRGLWGQVIDRTGFRIFPVGYHVDLTALETRAPARTQERTS